MNSSNRLIASSGPAWQNPGEMVPSVNKRTVVALLLLLAANAVAEDAQAKAAREELERQLGQMVGKQPTKVRVDFVALDDPNYKIEEATFELDGRSLGGPSLSELLR